MPDDALLNDLRRRMDGALEVLRKEFGGLRTGRASASLLEPITVTAYGNTVPLNQVASINVPEPRLITVQVWDRGVVKSVDKAIRESGLDLNPQTDRGPDDPRTNSRPQRGAAPQSDARRGQIRRRHQGICPQCTA